MKVHLLHPDEDTILLHDKRGRARLATSPPEHQAELIQDLQLEPLFAAMAGGEELPDRVARTLVLTGTPAAEVVVFRQQVLQDCLNHRQLLLDLYQLACDAVADQENVYRSPLRERAESRLTSAAKLLDLLVARLHQLQRACAQEPVGSSAGFVSPGLCDFLERVRDELDDTYLDQVASVVKGLSFRGGILVSGVLGEGSQGSGYLLRAPDPARRGLFRRTPLDGKTHAFTIPARDNASSNALGELRDTVLTTVSRSVNEAVDHVVTFFETLQHELGFYLGCVRLHEALRQRGCALSMPEPVPTGEAWDAKGLLDACLALDQGQDLVGNGFDADGKTTMVITGANGGGKSTFLRAIGVATLMMRCGMFVAATEFRGPVVADVHTHFRREEDGEMKKGKFDEELSRMSDLAERIRPGDLLLCNESFSATNEREGSQIGAEVFTAMAECGVRVVLVTHMFDLAETLRRDGGDSAVFLRASGGDDGRRTFEIRPGFATTTSHARDLFERLVPAPVPKRVVIR